MTASWQKIFSSNPSIGYWAQHARFKEAAAQGLTEFGSAKSPEAIAAVVRNTAIQGSLSILFAVLVLIVIIAAVVTCVKAIKARSFSTTEEPFHPSAIFAPSGMVATDLEKQLDKLWAEKRVVIHARH